MSSTQMKDSNLNVSDKERRSANMAGEKQQQRSDQISDNQTANQSTNISQQQQQRPRDMKPWYYSVNYSSSSIEKDGKRDVKEHFELKNPEMNLVAEKMPGKDDIFDVKIQKPKGKDTDEMDIETRQLSLNDLRNQVDQNLRDMECRMGDSLRSLGVDSTPMMPLLGLDQPMGAHRPLLGLTQSSHQDMRDRDMNIMRDRDMNMRDRDMRDMNMRDMDMRDRDMNLRDRDMRGGLMNRRPEMRESMRMFEDFDYEFTRMERDLRRMRDDMTRQFRMFERRLF